jgi:hypothetical protein
MSVSLAAIQGMVMGVFIGTIYHLSHDHTDFGADGVLQHFLPMLITAMAGCALLFVLAAIAWNRLTNRT